MIESLSSLWAGVGWTVAWQTTLALVVGLMAAAVHRRRPARADGLLLAAVVAALAMPAGTFAVRRLGWGMLVPDDSSAAGPSLADTYPSNPAAGASGKSPAAAPTTAPIRASVEPIAADALSPIAPRTDAPSPGERRPTSQPTNWHTWVPPIVSVAWLALSAAAFLRLAGAVRSARRLLAASRPLHDDRIDRALASAAERLKLNVTCQARVSSGVRCPVIWCSSRRPVVLLPAGFVDATNERAWRGIFCHELAHWKRRDHLSSLATDLLCCLASWQPLAWWAAREHAQLSELACDEWVLACGESAENYADSLLDIAPQRGAALALAVVRNRAGVVGRIRHILHVAQARPSLGKRWTAAVAGSTLGLIALAALAQQPPVKESSAAAAPSDDKKATRTDSSRPSDEPHRLSGVVLDLADKPVAGARVYWVGLVRTKSYNGQLDLFAEGVTDEQGRFTMSAKFDVEAYNYPSVFARHPAYGLGLRSYMFDEDVEPLDVHLPKATPLRGRIINSDGVAVAGAEVLPVEIESLIRQSKKGPTDAGKDAPGDGSREGSVRLPETGLRGGDLPSFWPRPVKTAVDGRFRIPGNDNAGTALLRITAAGFGPRGVTVTDDEALAEWNKRKPDGYSSPPLANNFTLVLDPPREFEGTVSDAKTGRPVAGTELVFESHGSSGQLWNRQVARATSDAQGHYRFVVPAMGHEHHFRIYPPLGYSPVGAHLYLEKEFAELFSNGRVFHNDIRLTPGPVVRGRVIDADSRAPVRDAAVQYRSPNVVRNDYWFSEPVLTDERGEFKITAVEGPGLITVETRSRDHIRTTLPSELAKAYYEFDPHAYAAIDVPAEGQIPPLELTVRRGVDLIVEPVGPDGQPVPMVQFAYRQADVPPARALRWDSTETPLRLRGCGPGKTYRLLMGTESCKLGAVAEVACDPASGPVKIVLKPTGGLRGRLVHADGTPASDISAFLRFRDDPPPAVNEGGTKAPDIITLNLPDYYLLRKDSRSTTDADGMFEFQGIVPGVYLYLNLNERLASGERYQVAGKIEPGKTLDMGQVTIDP
jgi:beta-lactamase regulating signal transducer with metallopeptidase domain